MAKNYNIIPKSSENLKLEIENFKNKFLNKTEYFTCEQDIIGLLMLKNIRIVKEFILSNSKKFKNGFIIRIYNLIKKRSKAKESLLKNLNPIVKDYMKEKKIRMVVDKKSILLADSNLDVTKDIMDLLNKKLKSINLD